MVKERKTVFTGLSDAIHLTFCPVEAFYDLMFETSEGEIEKVFLVLRQLWDKQQAQLERIYEAIDRTLGCISLENPMFNEYVEFEGQTFKHPEIIRAVLTPVKPQADRQEAT